MTMTTMMTTTTTMMMIEEAAAALVVSTTIIMTMLTIMAINSCSWVCFVLHVQWLHGPVHKLLR